MAADITKKVEDQLWRWGIVLGAAGSLFAAALALFGFTSFEGAKDRINQAATAATGTLNDTAQEKKGELERQANALSGGLKVDAQQAELIIHSYAPREKAVNVNLNRLEMALKKENARVAELQQIRGANPDTPIGSINSQLFQTEGVPASLPFPSLTAVSSSTVAVPLYTLGSTGDAVKLIQSRLSALGCYSGPISGEFDEATANGAQAFKNAFTKHGTAGVGLNSSSFIPISEMPDLRFMPSYGQFEQLPGDVGPLTWSELFSAFPVKCDERTELRFTSSPTGF